MKSAIRKMGNSHGVIIPKPLLAEIGVKAGDEIDLAVKGGKIVMAPPRKVARAGWAADSKRLAEGGEDKLAWPEFANDDDADLKW
jgi:antitoxin MazE